MAVVAALPPDDTVELRAMYRPPSSWPFGAPVLQVGVGVFERLVCVACGEDVRELAGDLCVVP